MAKTKAELLNEYRDLKKENLKLNNQLEHWKAIARKENDRVVDLAKKLDEKETEVAEWKEVEDKRRALIAKLKLEVADWKDVASNATDRADNLAEELDGKSKELTKWVKATREYEETIARLCNDLDECEKEKTLIKSQRDVLLKEAEEHLYQINDLQESFDILQAEVRKIQINEGVIHDQAYEEGYMDARHSYEKAVAARDSEIDRLIDDNDLLHWVLYQIHENQTK